MRERLLVPEKMDDPALPEAEHVHALRGLRRINRWTGNAMVAWQPIQELAESLGKRQLSLLDIATGSGDVPLQLLRYAAASGIQLGVDACDVSQTALDFARSSLPAGSRINLFQLDATSEPIPNEYDVVMCTTFLHHLSRADAATVLRKMRDAARKRVVIVDLERGVLNWLLVCFGCHLFSRSRVVHFDGPQSVRAAFTVSEIQILAQDLGFASLSVRRSWPCRFLLIGDV